MKHICFGAGCLLGAMVVFVDSPNYLTSVIEDGMFVAGMLALWSFSLKKA